MSPPHLSVTSCLQALVDDRLGGDASRLDELWSMIPDFAQRLRAFDTDGSGLHWRPKTFDGWYCVAVAGGFEVYYQERGFKEPPRHFADERAAVLYALEVSVGPAWARSGSGRECRPARDRGGMA